MERSRQSLEGSKYLGDHGASGMAWKLRGALRTCSGGWELWSSLRSSETLRVREAQTVLHKVTNLPVLKWAARR